MDVSRIERSKLLKFEDAAAGHEGVLTDEGGTIVVKPCTAAELAFYEETGANHPEFAALIPTFMGTLQLGKSEQLQSALAASPSLVSNGAIVLPAANAEPSPATTVEVNPNPVALRGKPIETETAAVLENIASGFVKPNVLDVKLGARLWDDDAPESKRQRLDKVAGQTTSTSLGFRVAGMKTFDGEKYRIFDKFYGRNLTKDTVREAFDELFDNVGDNPDAESFAQVLPGALDAVEEIEHVVSHQESRMFSSSLLFVYEGDRAARRAALDAMKKAQGVDDTDALSVVNAHPQATAGHDEDYDNINEDEDDDDEQQKLPKLFDVRVIDFAHATWVPGAGPDENMLQGIRSVMNVMKQMME